MFDKKNVLITGGAGFLGKNIVNALLNTSVNKIIVFSRDEAKHFFMSKDFTDERIRFIIGDIKDADSINHACKNVDYIIHAAALKQAPIIEYNPIEAIKTNIIGTINVVNAAIKNNVKKVVYISSDKANMPVNLYGASKFCSEKIVQQSFVYKENHNIDLICVRYGNVANSTGSIIPFFKMLINKGNKILPLTHKNMSRFWFDVEDAVKLIFNALENGKTGDIFIPKLKSFYIKDLIKAFGYEYEIIGKRAGEKNYESMINEHEYYEDKEDYFIVNPAFENTGFEYRCDKNGFLSVEDLKEKLKKY